MERRRQARYEIKAPVKIRRFGDDTCDTFESYCYDISSSGVFITRCGLEFTANQRVHIELTLTIIKSRDPMGASGKVTLAVNGSVVRTIRNGTAVAFDKEYSIFPG